MFLDSSQSKLVLNPSVAAKDSEVPGKDLDVKPSQEILQTEHGSIAGVSNEDRPNKRVETRNSSSHKPKVFLIRIFNDVLLYFTFYR